MESIHLVRPGVEEVYGLLGPYLAKGLNDCGNVRILISEVKMAKSQTVATWFTSNFSDRERDRRWHMTRDFLKERELDALLVLGSAAGDVSRYLLGNWLSGTVIFPMKGEPILMAAALQQMLTITPETPKDERPWIKDVRTGARGAMIVAALKEKGLERSHIGVIGLTSGGAHPEGGISYATWDRVLKRLPDCKFEDVGNDYDEKVMFVKSDEELVHVRRAAQVLEQAGTEIVKVIRPGVSELDVLIAMGKTMLESGFVPRFTQFGSGPNTVSPRPLWVSGEGQFFGTIGAPRVLQPGDIFITEMMASSKELGAQLQLCVAIPPVPSVFTECAKLARRCYEEALRTMRPGKTFEEVVNAMEKPLDRPDNWYVTPLIHSLNPQICVGPTGMHIERMPGVENFPQVGTGHIRGGEIVLEPGMVFAVEPDVCIGDKRVLIGGNVVVTKNEPEELNKVSTEMRIACGGK